MPVAKSQPDGSPLVTVAKNAPMLQPSPMREPMPIRMPPPIAQMAISRVGNFSLNSLASSAITIEPPITEKLIQSTGFASGLGMPFSIPKKMLSVRFIPSFASTQAAPCASCVVT